MHWFTRHFTKNYILEASVRLPRQRNAIQHKRDMRADYLPAAQANQSVFDVYLALEKVWSHGVKKSNYQGDIKKTLISTHAHNGERPDISIPALYSSGAKCSHKVLSPCHAFTAPSQQMTDEKKRQGHLSVCNETFISSEQVRLST